MFDDFLCFVNRSTCMNFLKTNRCLVVTFIPLHTTSNVIPFWDANTKRLGARQASCGVLYKQIRSFKVFLMTKIFLLTKKYNEKKTCVCNDKTFVWCPYKTMYTKKTQKRVEGKLRTFSHKMRLRYNFINIYIHFL